MADACPIPVILDTDIGTDIDDTWALIYLLRCPELDLKLVLTSSTFPEMRALHVAQVLEVAGRTDVPIGIGAPVADRGTRVEDTNLYEWVADRDLYRYPGRVYRDGPAAAADLIADSPQPLTVVAMGPMNTLADMVRRFPRTIRHSRLVAMLGNIESGTGRTPCAEANVRHFESECRDIFTSDWDITITPLETCGRVRLTGADYRQIRDSKDPLLQLLMAQNETFARRVPWMTYDPEPASSTLFDTVSVYLAYDESHLLIKTLPLVVTAGGFTREDVTGKPIRCALAWKDREGFEQHLVECLLNSPLDGP